MVQSSQLSGWTLIELLIVMAISALLSTLAIPSYQHWLAVHRRQQAQIQLYEIQSAVEQFQLDEGQWPEKLTDLSKPAASVDGFEFSLQVSQSPALPPTIIAYPLSLQRQHDPDCIRIALLINRQCSVYHQDDSTSRCFATGNSS
ncbi:type IV pilin protein [Celerinatantimonas yamalensis]|uniref:Type IV pilin protein n=1 Tax=Celerinatantimonas yamalensis TaxID=559956 RepID=A0ABW9GAT9_9GAMM